MIELLKLRDQLSEEIGVIENTKKGKGYDYTPFDDIWQKVQPLLIKYGLYVTFTESGSDTVTVKTTLLYFNDNGSDHISTSPSMNFYSISGMTTLHSRIAISTILKRIGLIEVLNLTFKDEEEKGDTILTEKRSIATNSKEWDELADGLRAGELDLDTALRMYEVTPQQKTKLSSYSKF